MYSDCLSAPNLPVRLDRVLRVVSIIYQGFASGPLELPPSITTAATAARSDVPTVQPYARGSAKRALQSIGDPAELQRAVAALERDVFSASAASARER